MKVFISWSGDAAKAAAGALGNALREVLTGVDPWLSVTDVQVGQPWFDELMAALEDSRFALVCLTRRTLHAPWIMFESGAVAAKFGKPRVVPLLLDGTTADLTPPLSAFQGATFSRDDVRRLFEAVNAAAPAPMKPRAMSAAFDEIWPALEAAIAGAIAIEGAATRRTHDVFLSVPMASFDTDAEYQAFRGETMKVVEALRTRCGRTVFCALEEIKSKREFETRGVGVREDMAALRDCSHFVMIYPKKMATSALFEAGYALALGRPCRFFVRDDGDLPYLMQRLQEAFTNVSILDAHDWTTYDDIGDRLEQNAELWFRRSVVAEPIG